MSNRFTRASTPDRGLQETLEQLIYRIEVLERKVSAGVLRGTTAPVISDGADNDWWLDVTNARLYGPKGITTAGTWDATFLGLAPSAWSTWTPTITQGVAVTKTVTYGKYIQIGKLVVAICNLAITSNGSVGSAILLSYPVTPAVTGNMFVPGSGDHVTATNNPLFTRLAGGGIAFQDSTVASGAFYSGQLLIGHSLLASVVYESV